MIDFSIRRITLPLSVLIPSGLAAAIKLRAPSQFELYASSSVQAVQFETFKSGRLS
ncbi:MAG: hypothetical protein K2Y40_08555 [Reyranella sp.]|nr:hypothetical protein [Reyranella sp.]